MEQVIAYKPCCCNKVMLSKKSARRHEKNCLKNPVNFACPTCKYLSETWETVYNPCHGGNPGSTDYDIKIEWCDADPDNPIQLDGGDFHSYYKRGCSNWQRKEG